MTNRILSKRCQLVRKNTSIALGTLNYLLFLPVLECNVVRLTEHAVLLITIQILLHIKY